jgi:signal transduction histidine kinase
VLDVAARAIVTKMPVSNRTDTVAITAVPVPRRERYAVVATVGLENLLEARKHAVSIALGFALPTIILVTLLAFLAVRLLVGQPLAAIVGTMEKTAAGDLGVRTAMARRDELGTIATRLDEMLDQLERFNRSLHERIARAERVAVLGQVAANVAHQAGTPLNLVSGYVQMIRDDPKTDERTRARLQTVDTQIQQVTRVLRSMLDYARQPPGFETVVLADIIGRVREIAQPRLSRANIRAQIAIADGLPSIRADVTQLEMALLNLVNNALDAMPGGGSLTISATAHPDGLRVEVADTGPGIPREILERLFEPWATTKPTGQGTGLGLAIVRDVIRSHGGSISAYNRATGAVFVIDLPAASSVAAPV